MDISLTVDENQGRPTGLLDKHGNEIWAIPDPIGYVWAKEE